MSPEEETEAAHFELWQGELEGTAPWWAVYLEESAPRPLSIWVRVGEMAAFLAVWSVILVVGVAFWVTVGAAVWWLVK